MPSTRRSSRQGNDSSPATEKTTVGTKRKASETTSPESAKSKRPTKEQKTLEESFAEKQENGDTEMKEAVQEEPKADTKADSGEEDVKADQNGDDAENDARIGATEESALESVKADATEDGKTTKVSWVPLICSGTVLTNRPARGERSHSQWRLQGDRCRRGQGPGEGTAVECAGERHHLLLHSWQSRHGRS